MSSSKKPLHTPLTRRSMLKASAATAAIGSAPIIFSSKAHAYANEPKGSDVILGFNVPLIGPYLFNFSKSLVSFIRLHVNSITCKHTKKKPKEK